MSSAKGWICPICGELNSPDLVVCAKTAQHDADNAKDTRTCGRCQTEHTGANCPTCALRRTNASIASNARWAKEPSRARATAPARAKGPGSLDYWLPKVDPKGRMTYLDRVKAAENAKREFYQRLGKSGRKAKQTRRATRAA